MGKILFFDMDGTLWNHTNDIPESTVSAIKRAQKKGHKAFINTGRSRAFIREKNLLDIGFDGIVSGCGTMIEYDGKVIFFRKFPEDEIRKILDASRRYGIKLILEGSRYLYADKEEYLGDDKDSYYIQKIAREMGDDLKPLSGHVPDMEIQKFSCSTYGCDRASYKKELEDDYYFIEHNDIVMEVVPKSCSKGTGIKKVCELLGTDSMDTFAFGDSINDKEMLVEAGTGVVMGSGTDEAKKYADYVTTGFDDDGIMNAMKHFELI